METTADSDDASYEIVEERELSVSEIENPYGFDKIEDPDFSTLPLDCYGYLSLDDCIELLVRQQFPLHKDIAAQKLCTLFGKERAGKTARTASNRRWGG